MSSEVLQRAITDVMFAHKIRGRVRGRRTEGTNRKRGQGGWQARIYQVLLSEQPRFLPTQAPFPSTAIQPIKRADCFASADLSLTH
jgi:hypothetical protein